MGMTPTRVCALFLLLSVSAVLVIFLAPHLAYTNHPYRSDQCYHFSSLCHQRPDRSFFLLESIGCLCAVHLFISDFLQE
ncbi:MAG: hypothetical protein AYK19_01545 [Theionarchaea archaeon DG-70-1]|nr:MAG: hypothetical protein AYK19_01545 [Theionarchaea archaeon DG-70-1]